VTKARGMGWRAGYLLAAFALFMADQVTKAWAVRALNTGIAFGQLQGGSDFTRWLLVGLACAAVVAVLIYFFRNQRTDDRVLGACALLLAGITGNLVDRIRLGRVVDFILLHAGDYHWPTFNLADAAICTGAFLLALDLFLEGRRARQKVVVSKSA